jgi:uncharacterized protein YdcH (DUF465 family)
LFSIFLCGAVVTYVGNAGNYKALLDDQKSLNDSIKAKNTSLTRQYTELTANMKQKEQDLNDRIQTLQQQKGEVDAMLRSAERKNLEYQNKVNRWTGVLDSFGQTMGSLEKSLMLTQKQLDQSRVEGIRNQKELSEIHASLYERIVQMQSLEAQRDRLLEQKSELEKQITAISASGGIAVEELPTFGGGIADTVRAIPSGLDLKGLITEVGESLVTISLGSDDGVTEQTLFHVTRGDEFICDIIITHVDTNKSAGATELVQQQPIVGDNVSTKL